MNKQALALVTLLLAVPAAHADIEGFRLRVGTGVGDEKRDEPIESWVIFEDLAGKLPEAKKDAEVAPLPPRIDDKDAMKGGTVIYLRCNSAANECNRKSPRKDIAERREVDRKVWLSEVARTYKLDALLLLNEKASAKRIDASIEALKSLEADKVNATDAERADAKRKLAQLTGKEGYRDRFIQAKALAAALAEPTEELPNLVIENTDRRAPKALFPFNFDRKSIKDLNDRFQARDVITGAEFFVLKKAKATWANAGETCRAADGYLPTAQQLDASAAWLADSALGKELEKNGTTKSLWLEGGKAVRVNPTGDLSTLKPTAVGVKQKLYYYWEGRLNAYQLDASLPKGGRFGTVTPPFTVSPGISQEWTKLGVLEQYDVVKDWSDDEVVAHLGPKSGEYGVLCSVTRPEK